MLLTCPGCTPECLPGDSWDWFQQTPVTPNKMKIGLSPKLKTPLHSQTVEVVLRGLMLFNFLLFHECTSGEFERNRREIVKQFGFYLNT